MLRVPPWHPSRWDWNRTRVELGLAQRYAKLTIDLDDLERIACAATPGPWTWRDDRLFGPPRVVDYGLGPERDDALIIETDGGHYGPEEPDRAHIAANSPDVTLVLITRILVLEAAARAFIAAQEPLAGGDFAGDRFEDLKRAVGEPT